MFIPKAILSKSPIMSPEARAIHQNFAKKYLAISKKHKPHISDEEYYNSLTEIPSIQLQKDIFDWFFSLDIPTRLKVSTIYNKWNTEILSQLLMLFFNKQHLTVKLSDKLNTEYYDSSHCISTYSTLNQYFYANKDIECLTNYYRIYWPQNSNINDNDAKRDENKEQEKDFIQMIKYITVNESNDALSLSQLLLDQSDKLKNYFMAISKNKIFTSWITLTQEEDTKMYNFTQQEWIKKNENYSIAQIILSFYEHIIQLNYQYYYYTKKIYEFPYQNKIAEIIDLNTKLELFLKIEQIDNVFKCIDLDSITLKIRSDAVIKGEISKQRKNQEAVANIFFNSVVFQFNDSICDKDVYKVFNHLRKESQKSIKAFIDMISFIEPKASFNFDAYIYKEIYYYIHNYYVEKNLDDLLADSSSHKDENKNKKKNNKKKKKKKEENDEKNKDSNNEKKAKDSSNKDEVNKIESLSLSSSFAMANNTQSVIKEKKDIDIAETQTIPSVNITVNTIKADGEEPENGRKGNDTKDDEDNTNAIRKKKKNKNHKAKFHLFPLKSAKMKHKSSNECIKELQTKEIAKLNNTDNKTEVEVKSNKIKVQSDSLSFINTNKNSSIPANENDNDTNQQEIKEENSKEKDKAYSSYRLNMNNNYNQPSNLYNRVINHYYPLPPYYTSKQSSIFSYNNMYYAQNMGLYPSNNINFSVLSNEIYSFNQTVARNIKELKSYKDKYKQIIEDIIKRTLEQKYNYRIAYFGSYVSNLALENSDIDVLIIYKSKANEHISIEAIINELVYSFKENKELFNYINPIYTASIPVIKLQCDFMKDIDIDLKQSIESDYLFNKSELFNVKFDLSFREEKDVMINTPSQNVLEYIRDSLMIYPDIKLLITVIKRFMQKEQLNSSFKGN